MSEPSPSSTDVVARLRGEAGDDAQYSEVLRRTLELIDDQFGALTMIGGNGVNVSGGTVYDHS